mgnify:CR=1 FL=1
MYWYDFGRSDVYVGNGGDFKRNHCKVASPEEKEKIAKLFSEHLLKIYYTDQSSYDNSDDERAGDSYYSHSSYVYRSVNLEQDLYGIVMRDGEITGVVFYVKNDRGDAYAEVFNFNGQPKNSMTLGYSASHSSSYTTVIRVELVKKGENGVPETAKHASFIQHHRYPQI